jgi:hypothetical protein
MVQQEKLILETWTIRLATRNSFLKLMDHQWYNKKNSFLKLGPSDLQQEKLILETWTIRLATRKIHS